MVGMEFTGTPQKILSAREMGIVACTRCTKAWPLGTQVCGRCGHKMVSRDFQSLQKVWALWLVGLMCYIPANTYPMLKTKTLFQVDESTIIGGAVELAQHGAYGVSFAYLAISVKTRLPAGNHSRQLMYEIVEYIGRWSMIDIFVVAILSSLVQLKTLATINPGPASMFFALSVIFTMLSAQAFDSRLIWDQEAKDRGSRQDV